MKKLFVLFAFCVIALCSSAQTFHSFSDTAITGDSVISMSKFYGKKVMVVNTASYCAYTPQFTQLEQLYTQYKQYGFEIIGFPCNDFGSQDPNDDSTIYQFCTGNYNVTFQMMSKIHTVTGDTAPVYKWLQRKNLNGVQNAAVSWNFNKFLIDEAGHWVKHYASPTSPLDTAITNWIKSPSVTAGVFPVQNLDEMVEIKSANPTYAEMEFTIKTLSPQYLNMNIYSMDGQIVGEIYNGIVSSTQDISYSVLSLPAGIYFLKIENGAARKTLRYAVIK